MFNVQLCVAGKADEFFPSEFHTGVNSNSCKPIDLRFMVISLLEEHTLYKYISK